MEKKMRERVKERMQGFCRACPRCDGRACAGEVPGMGGAGSGSTFIRNVEALSSKTLIMRTLHKVSEPDVSSTLFGRTLDMPVLAAPVGGVEFNMTRKISEGEYLEAVARGAAAAGTLPCGGDGEVEEIFESTEALLGRDGVEGIPFIKPWESGRIRERIRRIEAMGVPAFGMDVDAAGLVTLSKMGHSVYPKTPEELQKIAGSTDIPFIVKGIMSADEAKEAVEAGAQGIVVSNHGGRVLDSCEATVNVLPEIVEALEAAALKRESLEKGCTILVDGGIRNGTDIFKMLALGADAVLIGRPIAIAAIGGGAAAVEAEFRRLKSELVHAMVMTGTQSLRAISKRSLHGT
ncbi:MAG: alpha-hydroxy-acid oxidizing protein [Spirochaetaceae bacterium]